MAGSQCPGYGSRKACEGQRELCTNYPCRLKRTCSQASMLHAPVGCVLMRVQSGLAAAIRNSTMILFRHICSTDTSAAPPCVDHSLVKSEARQNEDRIQGASSETSATAELVKCTATHRPGAKGNH